MDRDHFIIFVYCLVCEHFGKIVGDRRLRKRGFAPALSWAQTFTSPALGQITVYPVRWSASSCFRLWPHPPK